METVTRTGLLLLLLLSLSACDYLGLDGYVNQLNEFGINHDLADAVNFSQNLVSRPREFDGKVYVLGVRGVYEMDAEDLRDYRYYPYTVDLGYGSGYDEDDLPPINCYRDPVSGEVKIMALSYDQGLRFGDTLTLLDGPRRAGVEFLDPAWPEPPVVRINDSGTTRFVTTDLFNQDRDTAYLYDVTATLFANTVCGLPYFLLNSSFRNSPDGSDVYCVSQLGTSTPGFYEPQLQIHRLNTTAFDLTAPIALIRVQKNVEHYEYKFDTSDAYISGQLRVSTNDDYIMVYGFDQDDDESYLLYDYSGRLVLERESPDYSLNAELAERGKAFYTSSSEGGVAKYVLD